MSNKTKKHAPRAAFTFVELIAAIMIVSLCIGAFAKIVHTAQRQRMAARTQQTAVDQLQNVLELLAEVAPERLAAGEYDLTPFEAVIARAVPEGKLTVTCQPLANDFATSETAADSVQTWRLDASVSWHEATNRPRRNVAFSRLLSNLQSVTEMPVVEEPAAEMPEPVVEASEPESATQPEGGAE